MSHWKKEGDRFGSQREVTDKQVSSMFFQTYLQVAAGTIHLSVCLSAPHMEATPHPACLGSSYGHASVITSPLAHRSFSDTHRRRSLSHTDIQHTSQHMAPPAPSGLFLTNSRYLLLHKVLSRWKCPPESLSEVPAGTFKGIHPQHWISIPVLQAQRHAAVLTPITGSCVSSFR